MTITFGNDNDVILYALEMIISHARRTQQIFVAQCFWWLASIIGLDQGLVTSYIDNQQSRFEAPVQQEAAAVFCMEIEDSESLRQEKVLRKCDDFL
jgi:hypothetical protein